MFQFVGRVLGVAHPPGYPLYVFLTHPFSYLPIGSLSYRINLFSALAASLAVALTFLTARGLGARITVSLAVALGFAFAPTFWSQAVIAEVYALNAAIVIGMLLLTITWGRTRRPGYFYGAVALFSAGLGHHITIVGFAPAIAAYALLTDRRFALRARTIAVSATLVAMGLLQYAFVLYRSLDPAAYVESRATTIPDLIDVVIARRYGFALFSYEWTAVLVGQVPLLTRYVLAPALTLPGLLIGIFGLLLLLRRQLPAGLLLSIGFVMIFGFVANYSADDLPVFLLPGVLVLWLGAAAGGEFLVRLAARRHAGGWVAAALLLLPVWNLAANYTARDRSHDVEAQVAFDGLFRMLPDRSVIVREDFLANRMVNLKLLGDGAAGDRQIELVDGDPDVMLARHAEGVGVFAFEKSARLLRFDGLDVPFEAYPVADVPLPRFLSRLPDGMVVALAVPAQHREAFLASGSAMLSALGASNGLVADALTNVVVGVSGASGGAVERGGLLDSRVAVTAGEPIGGTGWAAPLSLEAAADSTQAVIRQGGRDLVRSSEGVALALWNADGSRGPAFVLQPADGFIVPVPTSSLSVHRLRGVWPRTPLPAGTWTDVSASADTGSLMIRFPAGGSAVVYVGDDAPLAPRAFDKSSPVMNATIAALRQGEPDLDAALARDGLDTSRLDGRSYVYRIEMSAPADGPAITPMVSVLLAFGGVPVRAVARAAGAVDVAEVAAAFRVEMRGMLHTPDRVSEVLLMYRDAQAHLTGDGLTPVDWDGITAFRWMSGPEARLVLPLAGIQPRTIRVQAFWNDQRGPATLALRLNGVVLEPRPLALGWQTYEWPVPEGALRQGPNDIRLSVGQAPSPGAQAAPGVALMELRVIHAVPMPGSGYPETP